MRVAHPRPATHARDDAAAAGVHPKVIGERLGHASIGITLDTYSQAMPGMQEESAEKIDAGLGAALTGQWPTSPESSSASCQGPAS